MLISIAVAPGWGQIGGISGGKLFTPDVFTLAKGAFEFEPAYELQGADRGLGFRFSAGFGKFEAGVSLDNAVDQQAIGLKYALIPERLALTTGVDYDTTFHHYAAGIIYSRPISDGLTTDLFAAATLDKEWTVMAAVGYFVTDRFQPIVEMAVAGDLISSVSYGFTYAPNEKVLVVIGVEQLFGNGEKPLMSVAFTFSM
ncbi:MAG: hypothetical protein IIA60_03070 [Candidatus Marinimicrobia bacterium]|nr:hypothetical protein [Candidatus Neomarinimicrobiota bacterium]